MFFRLLFFFTLCFALATGPVRNVGNCNTLAVKMKCGGCCGEKTADCCAKGGVPADKTPQLATTSVDLKQAVVPALLCLGAQPAFVIPPTFAYSRAAAIVPVQPRLDVTCIRLI